MSDAVRMERQLPNRCGAGTLVFVQPPYREIRARYTTDTITVYQAYPPHIAAPAVAVQRFVPPFKTTRMTWIKPSFLWMMYRSGWATKPGQERVLAIEIRRDGLEWALANSCLSHPDDGTDRAQWSRRLKRSPVRIQWDPERDRHLQALPYRSIQIGLSGGAVGGYLDWITAITDITARVHRTRVAVRNREPLESLLPDERSYPVQDDLCRIIGATPRSPCKGQSA